MIRISQSLDVENNINIIIVITINDSYDNNNNNEKIIINNVLDKAFYSEACS